MDREAEDETTRSYDRILSITDKRARRRELNKLAQRNSRRRKGDNLTRLQSENAELKKKLAATRHEKDENNEFQSFPSTSRDFNSAEGDLGTPDTHMPYQSSSLPPFDGNTNDTHFGWFTLGNLQQKLSDTSKEVPFHVTLGQHFPLQLQQSQSVPLPHQGQDAETRSEVPPQAQTDNQDTIFMTILGGPGIAHTASLMAM